MTVNNTQLALQPHEHPATQTANSDVVLILGQGDQMQSFQVSSEAMTRASQPFEAMLHKNYMEARPSDGSRWVVHLPEDDPEAFGIIADIISSNTQKLPNEISLRLLYKTCILAEKYLMLHVLRNHVRGWYDKMWWCAYRRNGQIDPGEIQQHTSIACILGDHKSLWAGMTYYAYACRVVDDELVHWRKDPLLSGNETQSEVGEITEYRKLLAEELPLPPAVCFGMRCPTSPSTCCKIGLTARHRYNTSVAPRVARDYHGNQGVLGLARLSLLLWRRRTQSGLSAR